ncbi:MAG: hypothetical protein LBL66_04780 [Clostridiales bacterium]|nr:hypothetical protein [Clostridiales bacterium]
MELRRLCAKLSQGETAPLPVPRVITVYQHCVAHGIPGALINGLHYNDLQLLVMSLNIAEARRQLKQHIRDKNLARGIRDVREISAGEAVKFLKGNS